MQEQNFYDLTNPQKSIWNIEQFYKKTSINNIGGTIFIKDIVNFDLLENAINQFISLNDSYRINLAFDSEGCIKQFFSNKTYQKFELISLNSYSQLTEKEEKLISIPFSLLNAPLYKFTMFKFPDGTGGIIMIVHHLISDAFSCNLVANKIANLYNSLITNEHKTYTPYSYINYIESESKYINSSKFEKDKKFWNTFLYNFPEPVSLSTSNIKDVGTLENIDSSRQTYTIKKDLLDKIRDFCSSNKVSLYNFFMAVYSLYIGKVNDVNDLIIGTPILNRIGPIEKNTPGMFINTIPFRCNFGKANTFKSYVKDIALNSLSMIRHQKYSYQYILDDIREKNINFPNLYTILLSYQIGKSTSDETIFNYNVHWTHSNTNSDELNIHLFEYDDANNNLNIAYDYQNKKFSYEDINRLHSRINYIIEQVLYNPLINLSAIKLIIPDEQYFIMNSYNSCNKLITRKTVIDLFEEQVTKTPYNVAISSNGYDINYLNFNKMANYVAIYLKNNGVLPNDNICLFFNNSIELLICIYAILKLSACYVPIDTSYPQNRIDYILKNSNSKFILTNDLNCKKLNSNITNIININLNDILSNYKKINSNNLDEKPTLNALAYIIYTSGSTGTPKGVQISHKSLSNYIQWAKNTYVKNEITNFPLYSSIAFDLTITSVFTPLISGNTIYIYENSNPELLLKEIVDDRRVQILKLTPAHMFLLQDINFKETTITKLIVGGDILTTEITKKITELFRKKVLIYNEYGPTEATVGCMVHLFTSEDEKNYASVPIGTPGNNTQIFLLNSDLNLVPFGYNAGIYIGGDCLSNGYFNLPKKTSERFINSPFNKNELIYCTGDIGRLYKNGIVEYIGRKDFQVKINGYRIETGEVQSKILSYQNIKDCFVTAITSENKKSLCAYYVSEIDINLNSLKNFLLASLPKYMIPKHFIKVDNIPLTVNGKVDKSNLPIPKKNINVEYISPDNKLEKLIHDVFTSILKLDKISVMQNIFDLSVDSLTIIKVQTKLYSLGVSIDTQVFYNYPTIRDISNYITHKSTKPLNNFSDIENLNIPDILSPYTEKKFNYKNILLFGATGFLGIHILHELLENTNAHIYCIIREKDKINSIERFKQKYSFYFNDIEKIIDRITPITGDLYCENFNLISQTYKELSDNIDCVFSSAAIVKHFGNPELFYKTNVLGTSKIVNFCVTNKIPFHYVSTLSICGKGLTNNSNNAVFTEKNFYIGQNYTDNIYVKTKFQAESIILKACKDKGLIASIYRIGNITNRYTDGVFQENSTENAFLNRLASIINLNCMPEELLDLPIDLTPVDYCSKFIVRLSKQMSNNLNIFHLFNNNFLTYKKLNEVLYSQGYKLNLINLNDFTKQILSSNLNSFGITNYLSSIESNSIEINNDYTNTLLNKLNLYWPKLGDSYIIKIINYLKEYNFIGEPYETKE